MFSNKFKPEDSFINLLRLDPEMRFFNALRRSQDKSAEDFFATVKLEDIKEGGAKYQDFLKFKEIDRIRIDSKEKLEPILKKVFEALRFETGLDRGFAGEGLEAIVFDSQTNLQLAHKFQLSGVTKGFAADKFGRGVKAEELYIDISDYNSYIQNGLENIARKAYDDFLETGDQKFYDKVLQIDSDMKILGIEGQLAPGQKIGQAKPIDQKLSELMINAMDKGILTQKEVNQAITAAN